MRITEYIPIEIITWRKQNSRLLEYNEGVDNSNILIRHMLTMRL